MSQSSFKKDRLLALLSISRFFLLFVFVFALPGQGFSAARPTIAIIIDDLGDTLKTGQQAIDLPFPLTYSFLPQSRHTTFLASLASSLDKEIMLHLPMEPIGDESMGLGGLQVDMDRATFLDVLRHNMQSVPNFIGINNHMGSRLTSNAVSMKWLMEELHIYEDLYFVDSFTSVNSIAHLTAVKNNVPSITRDVFLDHNKDFASLDFHFERLIVLAKRNGFAVAIAHPHPQSLRFLARKLPLLESRGIQLVPVSQLIELKKRRDVLWRASLFPSPRAVKN
ncbi:MAG: divergent polysaccharide deacetylase family protein [Gammaproteobacteria bacterium]|nr:divergent polysaccharide deacetylase family protein [Gammaproteobacteria bacterium]